MRHALLSQSVSPANGKEMVRPPPPCSGRRFGGFGRAHLFGNLLLLVSRECRERVKLCPDQEWNRGLYSQKSVVLVQSSE